MIKEELLEDLKISMREKNVLRKNVIQMIRAAILQVEKDKKIELTDSQILDIMAKEAKKRKDSLTDYEKSGRTDLVEKIKTEIAIIQDYLPEPLSIEALEKIIEEVIRQTGAISMKDMGSVMKAVKEKVGNTADGKTINEIVKKKLG